MGFPGHYLHLQTQFGDDRCTQFPVIVVTDPQTHTHPQTGPITIHCTTARAQYKHVDLQTDAVSNFSTQVTSGFMMKKTISALELEVACRSRPVYYVYLANSGAKLYTADISTTNHV